MSDRTRRPQAVPERGLRAVVVAPRKGEPGKALAATLAELDRVGWILAAMVEPDRFLDAVRMVVNGLVDRVVVVKPEYFPVIVMATDLASLAAAEPVGARNKRIRLLPRPGADEQTRMLTRNRRPGPIDDPEPRTQDTDLAAAETANPRSEFRHAAAEFGHAAAESDGTQVPNSGTRQRVSDRHSRTVRNQRRRRG